MNQLRRDDWEGCFFGMLVKEPMLFPRWIVLFRLSESMIRKGRARERGGTVLWTHSYRGDQSSMSPFERPTAKRREAGVGCLEFEGCENANALIFAG